jgi:hypothetical protein
MRIVVLVGLLAACGIDTGTRDVHHDIEADFDGDGLLDHARLTDERDGFRHTFAYLDIWLAGEHGYETAKFKDGQWIWVDHARYRNLARVMRLYGY